MSQTQSPVVTDSDAERYIPFTQIPKLKWLPPRRNGSRLSLPTLWRWAKHGVSGVRLRTQYVGVTPCTTETDLREFFAAVAAKRLNPTAPPPTPARRQREIDAAEAKLVREGY